MPTPTPTPEPTVIARGEEYRKAKGQPLAANGLAVAEAVYLGFEALIDELKRDCDRA
jgi:hypothetical protein